MSDNLYLFANNNGGQAENNGSYRLYDMKIEGDPEGVNNGINYVDYLAGDGASYIDTKIVPKSNYTIDTKFCVTDLVDGTEYLFGNEEMPGASYSRGGIGLAIKDNKVSYVKNGSAGSPFYNINILYNNGEHINKYVQFKHKFESIYDKAYTLVVFGDRSSSAVNGVTSICNNKVRISYFKIYNESEKLLIDLRSCLDTQGVPCMYDEVSKIYFYNQGTGTFGYKKKLRDFQPVLDSNNIPCLLDKVNNKFYYNKGTGVFNTKEKVPYKKLKYICGDGASYINTGIATTSGYKYSFITNGGYEPSSNDVAICGVGSGGMTVTNNPRSKGTGYHYNYGWSVYKGNTVSRNDLGNNLYKITIVNNSISISQPMFIFCWNGLASGALAFINNLCQIYEFKIWDTNEELVQHLIPALDENNNVGMYDKVTETFFYNQGTGTFGYEVEELDGSSNSYTEIEYIESTGTQYIDTGVVPTANTDIDMTCRSCDYTDYISDGLILNLDGINNTRKGHVSDTQVWEDLSGNGLDFDLHNITINENSMYFTGDNAGTDTYSYAGIQDLDYWVNLYDESKNYTVELCIKLDKTIGSYASIISAKPSAGDVAKSVNNLVFKNTATGYFLDGHTYKLNNAHSSFTVSCNMNDITMYDNTIVQSVDTSSSSIDAPNTNAFWIGVRLSGSYYAYKGYIYSIRIYDRPLTDAERLYNHSVDVKRFGVETTVATCNTGKYMMNNLAIDNSKYNYKGTDTTVQPNLVASEGATLTMGSTNLEYLTDDEKEQAINNGWSLL